MSHHTDAQPPPTRIRKRMISDEAAWLQGNTPRTPICSPSGPLPKLSGRLGTPELATKEREIIRAGHAALRHHTAGLSERRGAQPPAALAIPRDAGVPARSQTAVPGAKAACGLLVLERPHTTSALSSSTSVTAVPADLDSFPPLSLPSQDRLPSYGEPALHPSDYCPPPSREAPSAGDSPGNQLFHTLYANHGLPTVSSQNSPVYRSLPLSGMGGWEGVEEHTVGAAVKSLALAEMREHSWHASRAESPERSPPHAHLDRNHAAFSKYQVLAELHAEERKTGGDATSHRLNSAPLSTTQRTASTGDGLQHTVSTRIPKSPGEASKRGGGEAESPNAAQLKQRGKEGSVDAVDWQELLNEHQQRIAQARSQGKIVRKLSPAVEAARVAAERMRLEKKEQEKAAILEAQEQLKNSMKGPRPRVAHTLDPDLESAWERKRQEKDNNRKEFCKKTNTDSQTFASRLADIKSKVADLREFTPEEKAQREALFSKREAAKRRAEMKLKSDNEDFMRTISGAKPRTQARLTEEDMRTRSQAKQNFANGKYHQQELKLQYDVAIELRRKMFRGAFKVSKETQEKIYLKGRDAAVAAMKMAGRAK